VTGRRVRTALVCGVALLALAVPFLFGPYRVGQFTLVLVYAVVALGLNLLVGYNGQISLGHGAFFALGAYTAALLIEKQDVHYLLTLPAAGAVCFAAGWLFGVPALRLRGLYLALVTLGLAIATPQLIKRFDDLTEGTQGLTVVQPTAPGWTGLADDQFLYLLTLAVAAVMFALAWNLVRGPVGRSIQAVRDGEIAAATLGVNLATTKTRVFAVSAAYAGVAGALYVLALGFVAPEAFTLTISFAFLAAVVVGGLATISGALFGALFIEFVPVYASDVNDALTGVIYGGVLIAFMWVLPDGAAGLLRRAGDLAARRRGRDEEKAGAEPRRRGWNEANPVHGAAADGGDPVRGVRTR
jgi:branched-chain amino acid transport system permease protein